MPSIGRADGALIVVIAELEAAGLICFHDPFSGTFQSGAAFELTEAGEAWGGERGLEGVGEIVGAFCRERGLPDLDYKLKYVAS